LRSQNDSTAERKTSPCSEDNVPLHRLELCSSAPEADALSTELQGRVEKFYHTNFHVHLLLRQVQVLRGRSPWHRAALAVPGQVCSLPEAISC
jgi:hypothetical protein